MFLGLALMVTHVKTDVNFLEVGLQVRIIIFTS